MAPRISLGNPRLSTGTYKFRQLAARQKSGFGGCDTPEREHLRIGGMPIEMKVMY